MKRIITLMLICTSVVAFAQKTNFSGNWKINKDKTNFGKAPEYVMPRFLKVEQGNSKLIVSKVLLGVQLNELAPVTDTLRMDDKLFQRAIGDDTSTTTIKLSDDHSFTFQISSRAADKTDTWTLDNNGKTLVINRSVGENGAGTYITKG